MFGDMPLHDRIPSPEDIGYAPTTSFQPPLLFPWLTDTIKSNHYARSKASSVVEIGTGKVVTILVGPAIGRNTFINN
jgi:hypothetical protein|tara:strand:+ start:990 stop:1220 length:231 start_codon:yes stop_codon:yes gene_type:complete